MTRICSASMVSSIIALSLASSQALAQGYSTDIEFVRPSFGHGSFVGMDVPKTHKQGVFRYGAVLQYERNPLTLYDAIDDIELGGVVANRGNVQVGVSYDLSDRVTLNALLPLSANWASLQDTFAADVVGPGDLGVGAKLIVLKTRRDILNIGPRAGVLLPTGRQASYMAENGVRLTLGLMASSDIGPVRIATDAGVMSRDLVETEEDFSLGTEVSWSNGVRVALPAAARTAFNFQVLSRMGLENFLGGGAENSVEAIAGVEIMPSKHVTLDLGAGRGLTEGYGTTDLRLLGGVRIEVVKKEPIEFTPPPPTPIPPEIIEDPPPPPPPPEEIVITQIVGTQIMIPEQIEFVVNTNNMLDQSRPIVRTVADLLNGRSEEGKDGWALGHIVIEGHASQEGDADHNYDLAESRARRVWEELLKMGVAIERISYRGKGEVEPLEKYANSEDEADLQKNRRVEFHIIRRYESPDEVPENGYPTSQKLPWSGRVVQVITPEPPAPEEEEAPKVIQLDEFGLPIDDDFEIGDPPAEDEK